MMLTMRSILSLSEFTGALVKIDISLLADNVRVATTHTLDGSQSKHDLLLTINISVEETQNVLELILVGDHERLLTQNSIENHRNVSQYKINKVHRIMTTSILAERKIGTCLSVMRSASINFPGKIWSGQINGWMNLWMRTILIDLPS